MNPFSLSNQPDLNFEDSLIVHNGSKFLLHTIIIVLEHSATYDIFDDQYTYCKFVNCASATTVLFTISNSSTSSPELINIFPIVAWKILLIFKSLFHSIFLFLPSNRYINKFLDLLRTQSLSLAIKTAPFVDSILRWITLEFLLRFLFRITRTEKPSSCW